MPPCWLALATSGFIALENNRVVKHGCLFTFLDLGRCRLAGLIPKVRTQEISDGVFRIEDSIRIFVPDGESRRVVQAFEQQVLLDIVQVDSSSDADIRFEKAEGFQPEAYRLIVAESHVEIHASFAAGWYYGANTLAAIIRQKGNQIACQTIDDSPRFRWRGMHLDVCRHFFDVDFVKRFIDLMALHKFNRFHWHLTEDQGWRIEIPSRPLLAEISAWRNEDGKRYGGFYTHDEIRDVVKYAADRFIEVVPEIETPGHSVAALAAYPELACKPRKFEVETEWGIFDDVYCAGNEQSFEFLEEVFDVVLDLFPGRVVHIGGDECPKTRWKECPKCQARMKEEGLGDEEQLQSWFIRRIVNYLEERGRHAIGWDEILEGGLADGAMVMSWQGTSGGIAAARIGHDVVMSPTSNCYFDFWQSDDKTESGFHGINTLKDVYDFEPVPSELLPHEAIRIRGGQGNVWTERMYEPADVEYMILPRMCALAEVLWSYDDRDWDNFQKRLEDHLKFLGDKGFNYRKP